jgi:hypothetical protein
MLMTKWLRIVTLFITHRTSRAKTTRITKILTLTATPQKIRLNAQSEAIEPISPIALED